MPLIQLQTGKTIYIPLYEYLFVLSDEDVDLFYQACVADDLGIHIDNPFSNKCFTGRLDIEDVEDTLDDSLEL